MNNNSHVSKKHNPITSTEKIRHMKDLLLSDDYSEEEKNYIRKEIRAEEFSRKEKIAKPFFKKFEIGKNILGFVIVAVVVFGGYSQFISHSEGINDTFVKEESLRAYALVDQEFPSLSEEEKMFEVKELLLDIHPKYEKAINEYFQ